MRILKTKPTVLIVLLPLALAGCPKSKTDTSSARTDVTNLSAVAPVANKPTETVEQKITIPPQAKPAKDPVPTGTTPVTQAGTTKKPEKTKKGDELSVSSTHVEVVKPSGSNVSVVITETLNAAQTTPASEVAPVVEVVEFPAVKLPGDEATVATGEAAAAILADPQPIQAAAELVSLPEPAVEAAPEVVASPAVVPAAATADLNSDLGQPIPASDVKEVVLTPNTGYTLTFVEAEPLSPMPAADAPAVDVASVVTLAAEPKIKAAEQIDEASIRLTIDVNGNPDGTLYSIAVVLPSTGEIIGYVDASTGEILKEGQERFHVLKGTELIVRNLQEDAELVTFVIQAQNLKGEKTSWSEEVAVVTVDEDVLLVDDSTDVADGDLTPVDPASVGIDPVSGTEQQVSEKLEVGQKNLAGLKDQLKGLKAKIDAVRKDLKAKNEVRREIQKKLKKLEKDAKKNAKEIEKLKAELDGVQLKIDQLGKELRELKTKIKELKAKVKDQAAEIKKLKKLQQQMKKAAKKAAKPKKK